MVVEVSSAHVSFVEALIDYKDDLSSHLSTKESCLFRAMAPGRRTRVGPGVACTNAGGVTVTLILEVWEIIRELQGVDRIWSLGMASRAIVNGYIGLQRRSAGVVMGGGHKQWVHPVSGRVVHWSRLAHGCRSICATCWKRSGEGRRNFRCEHSAGRREDEFLGNNSKQSLSEACCIMLVHEHSGRWM